MRLGGKQTKINGAVRRQKSRFEGGEGCTGHGNETSFLDLAEVRWSEIFPVQMDWICRIEFEVSTWREMNAT